MVRGVLIVPSSYTLSCRFTLQATGENNNTWGTILNNGVFALVDYAIAGRLAFTLSGVKTLTTALGATDEARVAMIDVTGGTGGKVVIPASSKGYFVRNVASGNVVFSANGAQDATFQWGDIGPIWTDGNFVHQLRLSNLNLRDYIASQVTGGGNLPSPTGNLNKVLIVLDQGLGPTWLPGLVGAASLGPGAALSNLGYTPVNKAGDTMTGNLAVQGGFYLGPQTRFAMAADESGGFANLFWDGGPGGAYTQYDWNAHTLKTVIGSFIACSMDAGGNMAYAGSLRTGTTITAGTALVAGTQVIVGGPAFFLQRNGTASQIVFDGPGNVVFQYDSSIHTLGLYLAGVPKFAVDTAGNMTITGTFNAAGYTFPAGVVGTATIADGAVTPAKLAPGAAVANIGYTPVNRAGDTITGNLGVNGNLGVGAVATVGTTLFLGAAGRMAVTTDNATYAQIRLDAALSYDLKLDWTTGKLTYYANNIPVFSVDAGGNMKIKGTFTQGTAP